MFGAWLRVERHDWACYECDPASFFGRLAAWTWTPTGRKATTVTTAGGDKSTSFTVYFFFLSDYVFFLRIRSVTPFKQVVFKSFGTSCRYLTPTKSQRVARRKLTMSRRKLGSRPQHLSVIQGKLENFGHVLDRARASVCFKRWTRAGGETL